MIRDLTKSEMIKTSGGRSRPVKLTPDYPIPERPRQPIPPLPNPDYPLSELTPDTPIPRRPRQPRPSFPCPDYTLSPGHKCLKQGQHNPQPITYKSPYVKKR